MSFCSLFLTLLLVITTVTAFYGGSMTFNPRRNSDGSYMVEFRFKDICDSNDAWTCRSGDCGNINSFVMDRVDSSLNDNWCQSEGVITRAVSTNSPFELLKHSCCWTYNPVTNDGELSLLTYIDLGVRSDTSEPNKSPITTSLPFIRVPQNCPRRYNLLAFDPDGDQVKCRYGLRHKDECGICNQPDGFRVDESSCSLSYDSTQQPGVHLFELVLEDFPMHTITLSYTNQPSVIRSPISLIRHRRDGSGHAYAYGKGNPKDEDKPTTKATTTSKATPTKSTVTPTTTTPKPTTTTPAPTTTTTAPTTTTPEPTTTTPTPTTTTPAPTTTTPAPTTTPPEPTTTTPAPTTITTAPTTTTTEPTTTTPAPTTTTLAPTTTTPAPTTTTSEPATTSPVPTTTTPAPTTTTTTTPEPTTTTLAPTTTTPAPTTTTPAPTTTPPEPTTTTSEPTTTTPEPTTTTPEPTTTPPEPTTTTSEPTTTTPEPTTTTPEPTTTTPAPTTTTPAPTTTTPEPTATSPAPTTTTPEPSTTTPQPTTTTPEPTTTTPAPTTTTPEPSTTTPAPTTTTPAPTTTTPEPSTTTPAPTTTTTAVTTTTPPLTTTTSTLSPLSKIPLQFSLQIDDPAPSCTEGEYLPQFLHPTPHHGKHLQARVNEELEIRVKAYASFSRIIDVIISGPLNSTKHKINTGEYVINWTPTAENYGQHFPFCFIAEGQYESNIYQSEMRCVVVKVEAEGPKTQVICAQNTMSVTVERSSIKGLHGDHLRLIHLDPSCQVYSNSTHVFASIPLNHCGTQMEEDDKYLIFRNKILTFDDPRDIITRKHEVEIEILCKYQKRSNITVEFDTYRPAIYFTERGFGSFSYQFEFYHSASFNNRIAPNSYPLEYDVGEMIYMQIEPVTPVQNSEVFLESCVATPYDNPKYPIFYPIIKNGCIVDETVQILSNHKPYIQFGMEAFKFIELHDQVFISCSIIICEANNPYTRCSQGCINSTAAPSAHHHVKREAPIQTASHFISQGPLRLRRSVTPVTKSPSVNLNLVVIAGCLLAAVAMVCGAIVYRSKRERIRYQPLPSHEF